MKERQRWQPEEDALLLSYVEQYGPKEWNLISQRMSTPLHRDPKSCLERYKNYLKPGIKRGSLTPEEQSLVISLQSKYGNKWKKIAAELPGRTAKRLGKWWEVFKEKQQKQQLQLLEKRKKAGEYSGTSSENIPASASSGSAEGLYDHILETFAEKYVQPKLLAPFSSLPIQMAPNGPNLSLAGPAPILSLGGSDTGLAACSNSILPPWMNLSSNNTSTSPSLSPSCSTTPSPSVSLTLSPSEPDPVQPGFLCVQHMGTLIHYCKEVEEERQNWLQHKKEATWRLSRVEQQLESEKARKRREKIEETEERIRLLRGEEMAYVGRMERECKEQLSAIQRDAESKEAKLMEAWSRKHDEVAKLLEQLGAVHNQRVI
uniref:MYB transcription factor n=1 Tax=Paeonia suffruticosa TaxID=45171 RepID=A0A7M4C3D5_PAESU|nr:MYB transcription factor [Paeonia suffruticosa]